MEKVKEQPIECIDCFKIICKQCGWEANDEDIEKIKKEEITACPICGWQPY